jgi:hypothetical protein
MSKLRTTIGLGVFLTSATFSIIGAGKAVLDIKNDLNEIIDDMYEEQFRAEIPKPRLIVSKVYHTKNFLGRHKVALAVASTATVTLWMHKRVVDQYNEFLDERGLLEEYWNPIDEAALVVLA